MIRIATEQDAAQIRALAQSIPGFWHAEWRPDAIERAIRAADGLAFVWEDIGGTVGFCCAHDVGFLGYLSLLVVAESAQGQGIGKQLVQYVERELAARGCATLISDVWQDAVTFYQALGWSAPGAVLLRQRLVLNNQLAKEVNPMVKLIMLWLTRSILVGVVYIIGLMIVGVFYTVLGVRFASANQATEMMP